MESGDKPAAPKTDSSGSENLLETPGEADLREGRPMRLPDRELRRCLWIIAVSWGVFGSAWMSIAWGAAFPAFATDLGASTFAFGALSALRFLAVIAQIPGAYWVERARNRKRIFFLMHLPARSLWLVIAALPLIVPERFGNLRVGGFMFLVLIFSLLDFVGGVAWMPWVADIIPDRVRARFLSQRQRLSTFAAMVTAAIVGWLLDLQPAGSFHMYTILFAAGALLGLIDIALYWRVPNVPMIKHPAPRLLEMMRRPLRDRRFRFYLIYTASSTVSGSIMGTFIWLFALQVLKLGKLESSLYLIIISSLATILTTTAAGALADRYGNRPVLVIAWAGLVITPFLWALAGPHSYLLLTVASIIGGVCGGITMMLGINLTFAMTPRAARSAYVALNSVASGLAGFVSPLAAGALAEKYRHIELALWGWRFGNLHLLLIAVGIYRLAHTLWLVPRLPEERRISTRAMLRELLTRGRTRVRE